MSIYYVCIYNCFSKVGMSMREWYNPCPGSIVGLCVFRVGASSEREREGWNIPIERVNSPSCGVGSHVLIGLQEPLPRGAVLAFVLSFALMRAVDERERALWKLSKISSQAPAVDSVTLNTTHAYSRLLENAIPMRVCEASDSREFAIKSEL